MQLFTEITTGFRADINDGPIDLLTERKRHQFIVSQEYLKYELGYNQFSLTSDSINTLIGALQLRNIIPVGAFITSVWEKPDIEAVALIAYHAGFPTVAATKPSPITMVSPV